MAWVLIVASLVLLWLASRTLCKFLHASTSPFFTTGGLFSHPFSIIRLISLFLLISVCVNAFSVSWSSSEEEYIAGCCSPR
jgi:hypothetical protein